MANKYKQPTLASAVRFEKAPLAEIEYSKMRVAPRTYTAYNAGRVVPIRAIEVLPHTNLKMSVDVINRLLSATIVPTMDTMQMDIYAFFVSNREINDSWKNTMGENTSGFWNAPEVELVPLKALNETGGVQIPVGSLADYYGLPTQGLIRADVLHNMNDLIPRGYFSIYNEYFRDQNYQPPVPISKLNIYHGFLSANLYNNGEAFIRMTSNGDSFVPQEQKPTGAPGGGAIAKALLGSDGASFSEDMKLGYRFVSDGRLSFLGQPLRANKLHDAFTSALPSPQKGPEIFFGVADTAPVQIDTSYDISKLSRPLKLEVDNRGLLSGRVSFVGNLDGSDYSATDVLGVATDGTTPVAGDVSGTNLIGIADLSRATGVSINDLRRSAAIQQVYEQLARGGSRYREFLRSFFGLNIETPFKDIPTQLGHMRIDLDMYQVAQTSASVEGETPQGSLTAYGYTDKKDFLFDYTAIEHGFIHLLAVVRQKNTYSTFVNPYWFRRSTLDWYLPQLANIGEQPIRKAILNPFDDDSMETVIGYQEAWWEYRNELDMTTGALRSGLPQSLGSWTYADNYDSNFSVVDGEWLYSNAQEVLDRTLAVTSDVAPQFIACFTFDIEKEIPMPTYSVPGMDII